MFPHLEIHKHTWTSPEGKKQREIHQVLIDRRWHSSILDERSFRGEYCDADHNLVAVAVRERLAVSKRGAQKIDMERFNIKKFNEGDVKEKYQATIKN
jgi:hypothetical protein